MDQRSTRWLRQAATGSLMQSVFRLPARRTGFLVLAPGLGPRR
jgi:hypothetical protein